MHIFTVDIKTRDNVHKRMAKRSDFPRRPQDAYDTIDPRAVAALVPFLRRDGVRTFAEPCCGNGHLLDQLTAHGLRCVLASDIRGGIDALTLPDFNRPDAIITNPPWTRKILHPMIQHFVRHAPTWLLFDSDWAYNAEAAPYLSLCTDIVVVGRLKWIAGTPHQGKDNVSWYRFAVRRSGQTVFHNRRTRSGAAPGSRVGQENEQAAA